ncbi:MAG TPA: tyrosine--tRNA ligase [Planctomycetes bacterium]|nr:tyrosine--tRNA ligase [Planctomycetota bacterium]
MGFPPVEEQLEIILRGVVDCVTREELEKKLRDSKKEGRPLRVKLGIDPSSPDIHVGHTVQLRKLRAFQELGHQAVVIWGTATAMVGDPTGKDKTRPQLTREGVYENLATYKAQISKIVDIEAAEHVENSQWFEGMNFMDGVKLLSRMTVARAIERDNFENRMKAGQPIHLHEIIYPLMQGWDSVEVRADIELGGTDQLFNLLVGRDLQGQEGMPAQVCLTHPLIEGLDGVQKMSKSLGNAIGLTDEPSEMFGKVMSIPDSLMEKYFLLLTDLPEAEVRALLQGHPREAKARLGMEIVSWLHSREAGEEARAEFDRVFQKRELPSDIPEIRLGADLLRDGKIPVFLAVAKAGLAGSTNEARRILKGGGIRVDGEKVGDEKALLGEGRYLIQVGKRRFGYVKVGGE